ncbi:RNA polymerase subunit sigma-24 [Saccharibacillus sacchari]|uniref:RNA polymerase subunit sigma-24 n=1 Tax=Saccharibacillus sacchari TaxID=456493 RepID=A0ACC6PIC4_9BACL
MLIEQKVAEQMDRYRWLNARIRILETYSIGSGVLLHTIFEDDRLQELHEKLKGQPSYMYLSPREQELEMTAHINLERYPIGIYAQGREIEAITTPPEKEDPQGHRDVIELKRRIQRVVEARTGGVVRSGTIEEVIDRIAELQELQAERANLDNVLDEVSDLKPEYTVLLKLRYAERRQVAEVVRRMNISRKTYDRYRERAVDEYAKLAGLTHS